MTTSPRSQLPLFTHGSPRLSRLVDSALLRLLCLLFVGLIALGAASSRSAAATIGATTAGGSFDAGGAGYLDVSGPYATSAGAIDALNAYVKGETQALSLRGVVYADAGGRPGSLVAATREVGVAAGAPAAWLTMPFTSSVRLSDGAYWLGFWYGPGAGSGGGGGFAYASASGSEWYGAAAYGATAAPPATFPAGSSSGSRYSVFATVTPLLANTALPAITGSAIVGQALTASPGTWSESPTATSYQWQRCDASGVLCNTILGASGNLYTAGVSDIDATLRVAVTATNSAGNTTATSNPTPTIAAAPAPAPAPTPTTSNLGTSTIGASNEIGGAGYLDLNGPFTLANPATANKLVAYLAGTSSTGKIRPLLYTSNAGAPGALLAAGPELQIAANKAAAWTDLSFATALDLPAGSYYIGFWYGGNVRVYNATQNAIERYIANPYSSTATPNNPFGNGGTSTSLYSLYLPTTTSTSTPTPAAPANTALPAITGSATVGQALTASPGTWSGSPTATSYQWQRCDTNGANCNPISGATTSTYTTTNNDLNTTLRVAVTATNSAGNTTATSNPTPTIAAVPSSSFYEDTREGFPKIVSYRAGCYASDSTVASFDWMVLDGNCASKLDAAHVLNPSLLGMIQPNITGTGDLFSATYGAYDLMNAPLSDGAIGSIRAFQDSDLLHDTSGTVHAFGSVHVLNWLSNNTALWSADVVAYWAKQNGALSASHPGVMGVWGDNDFWSDQGYAFGGTGLDSSAVGYSTANANRTTWDDNFVAHHNRLANDLPGMVIGGNDVSSYSSDPGSYMGTVASGWLLPGLSSAGMRECVDKYGGLYTASGVDNLITSAQRFLAGKALDGKQRYLMLNNCDATSDQLNEFSLAVATIGGYYYWPYTQSGWWSSTLTIAPAIPDVTRGGARHWLGFPTGAPQKLASGLWKRAFEHGVVYVNMSGSSRTVDGRAIGNQTGLFVGA